MEDGKNEVQVKRAELLDNIDKLEEDIKKYILWYGIFVGIISIGLVVYTIFNWQDANVFSLVSGIFIGVSGWIALKTWHVSFIFNLKQNRRNITMQKMLSHQQSNIYQESKLILREYFPDDVNAIDIKPIPSVSDLPNTPGLNLDKQQIESIENAIEGILNAYEGFAAAIIQGYVDESYLRETIRGQVVRVCGLLSNNIRDCNSACNKTYEHLIAIYALWHDENIDGQKFVLKK